MKITKLRNTKTFEYEKLKELIFSSEFAWQICSAHNKDSKVLKNSSFDFRYFSHMFLKSPGQGVLYPESTSPLTSLLNIVLSQIFSLNDIDVSCLYRSNANLLPPFLKSKRTLNHVDHDFPHHNLLIYLTDAGGKTIVGDESHDPKEDDIIMFPGSGHCIETSHTKDRVVIVSTFGIKKVTK